MNNKNFEVYFDYGSSSITAAAFDKNDNSKNTYYKSELFYDHLKSEQEIEKIIFNIEKNTNEYLNDINLMIDSPDMISIGLSLSKNFDGIKLKKEDIQFLIQDAKQQILRNYSNRAIIHIIVKNYNIDNLNYNYLNTNINCNSLSIDIIFISLPKENIKIFKKLFHKFNVSINQIFCSSYTRSINYKEQNHTKDHISFLDIGFNKTSITHFNKNKFSFFYTLPIGSNHITKDIFKILDIGLEDAEKIKINYHKKKNFLIEKKYSNKFIEKIISARINEILNLSLNFIAINESLVNSKETMLVLLGNGSKILNDRLKEKTLFSERIVLLNETHQDICESAQKLNKGLNKQDIVVTPKKPTKKGFFERLFHLFE